LLFKVLFMSEQNQTQSLDTLQDIKRMMEKSSRFISLSGWSGIAAGICALAGAWFTSQKIECWKTGYCDFLAYPAVDKIMMVELVKIAAITFLTALLSAFFFTWLRSQKTGVPVWGYTARKVIVNVAVPMIAGGLLVLRMMHFGIYGLIAPTCLLFYGLALINASKYTLPEIRYLGYCQLVLGFINLWMIGYGLYFWAAGFGLLHIIYGFLMWWKYERAGN